MAARILIADADVYLAKEYSEHLAEHGYEVHTATDAVQCIHRLRQSRPTFLVLSTALPWGGCDGVLAMMKEEADLRPEFVILLVSLSERNALYHVASYHIDDYLFKPFSPLRLVEYMKALSEDLADRWCAAKST